MNLGEQLQKIYDAAKSYPALVANLVELGIKSYTVEVSSGATLYRLGEGETFLHQPAAPLRAVGDNFSEEKTIQAVRDSQKGITDYEGFLDAIAAAGVRFYEAVLNGVNKRVIYIGGQGQYEEKIPPAEA